MNYFLLLVGQLRRPAELPKERQTSDTASMAAQTQTPEEGASGLELAALHLLQVVTLLALPLTLYLVYTHSDYYGYHGMLAAAIFGNLLVRARIDAAHHQQIQKELQFFQSDNSDNHE